MFEGPQLSPSLAFAHNRRGVSLKVTSPSHGQPKSTHCLMNKNKGPTLKINPSFRTPFRIQ